MTVYLLDINVLLALSDPSHVHHDVAHNWFAITGREAWATCPLTENGYVRIASHPKYPNRPGDVVTSLDLLRQFFLLGGHHFWSDEVTLRDWSISQSHITHGHVTDIYLLQLAVYNGGKLATLDRRIPAEVVHGGMDALHFIA
jgi:uncharacterized protein